MKYLCLIYDDEKKWETMSKAEADAYMGEYFQFTENVKNFFDPRSRLSHLSPPHFNE